MSVHGWATPSLREMPNGRKLWARDWGWVPHVAHPTLGPGRTSCGATMSTPSDRGVPLGEDVATAGFRVRGVPLGLPYDFDWPNPATAAAATSAAPARATEPSVGLRLRVAADGSVEARRSGSFCAPCLRLLSAVEGPWRFRPAPSRLLSHTQSVVEMSGVAALACASGAALVLGLGLGAARSGDAGSGPWVHWLPYDPTDPSTHGDRATWSSPAAGHAVNVAAIMAGIVGSTIAVACLYALGARLVLHAAAAAVGAAAVGLLVVVVALTAWPSLDAVTLTALVYNAGVGTTLCISMASRSMAWSLGWPCRLHILVLCVALAWPFLCLPEGTLWPTLLALVVWDCLAVLTPCGPLRLIVKGEQVRTRWHAVTTGPCVSRSRNLLRQGGGGQGCTWLCGSCGV